MLLELHPSQDALWATPTPTLYQVFQSNPNRPYNTLVKSLYEQATQAYAQGDTKAAIEFLEKALKVDPEEPQTLAFMTKIVPPLPKPTPEDPVMGLITKAQKAEKEKDVTEARKCYLAALKLDPQNHSAREGIERIRNKALERSVRNLEDSLEAGDMQTAKTILAKIKAAFPHDPRISGWESLLKASHLNSANQKAKADAAYNLGLESYRKDDFASAKRFWEEAIEADPQYLQARQNLERLQRDHPELK
jgi:tetratricopeptide (TPR) repeat protein